MTYQPCPFDVRLARTPYLVIPKLALQAMPSSWIARLEALLVEADEMGLEAPSYIVLRDDPEFSREVPKNEDDPWGSLERVDVLRPDPWANYRRGSVEALCPNFKRPQEA